LKTLERLKERIEELYKTYNEPELDENGKLINKKIRKRENIEGSDDQAVNKSGIVDQDTSVYDDQEMMDDLRK
jgi:hypothetical protein